MQYTASQSICLHEILILVYPLYTVEPWCDQNLSRSMQNSIKNKSRLLSRELQIRSNLEEDEEAVGWQNSQAHESSFYIGCFHSYL